jgi:hypothetical protein
MKFKRLFLVLTICALGWGIFTEVQQLEADPKSKTLSLEAVEKEVAGLKKENVAWRNIAWKTCLLEGLKASREQNKPIMLWIFIDRPIDDERC